MKVRYLSCSSTILADYQVSICVKHPIGSESFNPTLNVGSHIVEFLVDSSLFSIASNVSALLALANKKSH